MTCTAQTGLLVLRALCAVHLGTGACPECLLATGAEPNSEQSPEFANRQSHYNEFGVGPAFGAKTFFSPRDRASLWQQAARSAPSGSSDYEASNT